MQLYIPEIGDHIELMSDWNFTLYDEYRNEKMWNLLNCYENPDVMHSLNIRKSASDDLEALYSKYRNLVQNYRSHIDKWSDEDIELSNKLSDLRRKEISCAVTLPKSSILSFDRIYIRKGASDYSSISFYLKFHPKLHLKRKPRFWAKLEDCNTMEYQKTEPTVK